jgi:ABC-type glycerol-3-phosphate transport system permease component
MKMRNIFIYTTLLAGSVVFAWPFIWMVSNSAKLERELFSDHMRVLPQAPRPRLQSPYLDDQIFADVNGSRRTEALQMIEDELVAQNYPWPDDLPRAELIKQTARGVFERLLITMPREHWDHAAPELRQKINDLITAEMVADISSRLRRVFCIGQLRVRSYDLEENQLVAPQNAAIAWQIDGTAHAELKQAGSESEPYAELHYDFSHGNAITLTQTFSTSFPVARLHRIQLYLRNDDTWHAINLTVEKLGARLRAEHATDDADVNWVVDTWQEPGPDDRPDKIRTWTLLKKIDTGPQYVSHPNQLKLTLELSRRDLVRAWAAKILHNYRLTFDYMPLWRYVATSLFLIILNLIGTLFSCSLVAYSFARLQWPGRTICFALLLATMMIPPQVTMIPQFLIFQNLGWYNTLKPLWVMSFFASAFSVFLLRQFLKGIPRDLEDAARLDGCGFIRIYWHIMLPLVKPTLAVIAIFTFLATWNEFMMPLIYLSDQRIYPLSFGLYAFQIQSLRPGTGAGIGVLMAGSLLMTLPVIAIFFFAQRYFLQGVTLTGLKG